MILTWGLRKTVGIGKLTLIDADGRRHVIEGAVPGPETSVRLYDRSLHRKLATNPWLHIGEAYTDGTLTIEEGTLGDFIEFCCLNLSVAANIPLFALSGWFGLKMRRLQQFNPVSRARRNVAHHYDLSGTLYDLFLDTDRQYSCAYFTEPGDSLETAQLNKKRHLAAKLLLEPGHKVLDIGSGWGGLGLYLAETCGVDVTGVTLSEEQYRISNQRARDRGMADRVRFLLDDYRKLDQRFDRIVSVGMFEHVGAGHFREFFAKVRDMLTDDGICLLHSIGRMEKPGNTCAWLRKYIFPGGYSPAMSEVLAAVEREGLYVCDIEILRMHYARTLAHWHARFQANRGRVAQLYDERFCRMWEFYLKGCEIAFRHWNQMVFQMQITRHQDAVPLTRDYIVDWERQQAEKGKGRPGIAA